MKRIIRMIKNKIPKNKEIKGILKMHYEHKDNDIFQYKNKVYDEFVLNKSDIEKLSIIYNDFIEKKNYYNNDDVFILSLYVLLLSKYRIDNDIVLKYLGE